jgi:Ca2+-transporting ATPase
VGALCSDAALAKDGDGVGDPLEVALLEAAAAAGAPREELLGDYPEVREEAFDAETRRMTTVHRVDEEYRALVKGAPEAILASCVTVTTPEGSAPLDAEAWQAANEELASRGLRVLAFATRTLEDPESDPHEGLSLLGLVGLEDPPRDDVAAALASCHDAGVQVVMVTGDQRITAESIGRAIGLVGAEEEARVVTGADLGEPSGWDEATRERILQARVFARMSPEQKLRVLEVFQAAGEVVAMTGDGVNDAPALKKADIGIAMGGRGTQVAKEAADLVLLDDAFATIVLAMAQGRVILGNIRNFLVYLLSCNLAEILLIGMAGALGKPLPILPLQILYLNLVTDVFPAFALGFGEEEGDVMTRPPRDPKVPILERRHWTRVTGYGFLLAASTLAAFLIQLERGAASAVSVAFATLSIGQTLHVFNMRDADASWVSNEVTRNPFVWWAIAACVALTLLALAAPGLSGVLKLTLPDATGSGLVLGFSLTPLVLGGLVRRVTG